MNKLVMSFLLAIGLIGTSKGDLITFIPVDNGSYETDQGAPRQNQIGDLQDLSTDYAFLWRLDLTSYLQPGMKINSAVLTFDQVYVSTTEDNDVLYLNIVDVTTPKSSETRGNIVTTFNDIDAQTDFFNDYSLKPSYYNGVTDIGFLSDPNGGSLVITDQSLAFSTAQVNTLNEYVSDNKWLGIGIDTKNRYYNTGVKLQLDFVEVPEPSSLSFLLVGFGLFSGFFTIRRRK